MLLIKNTVCIIPLYQGNIYVITATRNYEIDIFLTYRDSILILYLRCGWEQFLKLNDNQRDIPSLFIQKSLVHLLRRRIFAARPARTSLGTVGHMTF